MRAAKDGGAGEVIDGLEKNAREIDRIDTAEIKFITQDLVIEHIFYACLGVVESTFQRDRVNILRFDRGHLAPLHVRYAAMRKKDEDIDLFQACKGFDRRGARIAGGCANDGRPLALCLENMVDELGEELHRQVLEGESRPVKQFKHKKIGIQLSQGRDRRVPEVLVSSRDHLPQGQRFGPVCQERRDDRLRDIRVRLTRETGNRGLREPWIGLRQVQAAIRREAGQQCLNEGGRWRLAARRYIFHWVNLRLSRGRWNFVYLT